MYNQGLQPCESLLKSYNIVGNNMAVGRFTTL